MARITAITPQKEHPDRYNLFVDGTFAAGLALDVIVQHGLRVGDELSPDQIIALQDDENAARALQDALRFLSFRPRSITEVRRYLARRTVDEATMDRVIARLADLRLLDDKDFAAYWVENRQTFSPRGPRALQAELRQKGVDQQDIVAAIEEIGGDEETSAEAAARPRLARLGKLDSPTFRRRMGDFLLRRGFTYDVARRVTDKLWTEVGGALPEEDEE